MSSWRIVEHTADVGLEASGETLEAALEALLEGFGRVVCPEGEVASKRTRSVAVEAPHLDDLVVDLLDEVNFVHQIEHFVPAEARVALTRTGDGHRVEADLVGEGYDRESHGHLMEIKATTYHGLAVETDPPRIEVLFDV